jgi:DNA topoisomerase-1
MLATASYLIDVLGLRVGDEKDPDEADTVGATTLRPEHVTLREDGRATFRFLGKDSVRWNKTIELPERVYDNLALLLEDARPPNAADNGKRHPTRVKPQIFPDIRSQDVNAFLSELQEGLTAKVFRTHHSTQIVRQHLARAEVQAGDPEYAKWQAANMANLQAAMFCNHTKKAPASWHKTRQRYREREQRARERVEKYRTQVKEYQDKSVALRQEAKEKIAATKTPKQRERKEATYARRLERAERRITTAQERLHRAQVALAKLKAKALVASRKRTWNTNTSLKSYIDPRVYYRWGQCVEYDVLDRYYSKTLRRKFSWVRNDDIEE